MKCLRRNHAPDLKAQMVLAALMGDKSLAELARQSNAHPNQNTIQKAKLLEWATQLLEAETDRDTATPDVEMLHARIRRLVPEDDLLADVLGSRGPPVDVPRIHIL